MTCSFYQKFNLDKVDQQIFEKHLRGCPICQKLHKQDSWLLARAAELQQNLPAPDLWRKIENTLQAEKQRTITQRRTFFSASKTTYLRLAAALVLMIGVSSAVYMLSRSRFQDSGILTASVLERVEKNERAYLSAIAELEQEALPRLAEIDLELMLLYRDRLSTIDDQIARCKDALADNPANAHIRRYMLAALQDKKQTLQEILSQQHNGGG
ncbi:MAG: hypothetical protein ACE5HS_17135 [bacterium]